ncbi:MAG: methionyl-tRNA formyltransferase [Candidatus Falkowbacteria bacterium]|nr:methionyl-tRNA formyltransferase [Candidatus Falkowbacteria bacterium]
MSITGPDKKIRVIFMGTPEFAVPGLSRLLATPEFEIVGVFTQPDKPVGRKQILTPSPIKELALKYRLPFFQPEKIRPETATIKNLKPDLIVVIAYGKIIPPEILDIPTFGCINVHASLLPKYRGAACLNAPILNGDAATGVTIMKMEAGLDTGPILRQAKIKLSGSETLKNVHDRLAELSAELLVPTLLDFIGGKIKPQIQDDTQASYIKTLSKEDGRIDFQKSAVEIERMIRAYNPWPGTYTAINGEILKIIAVEHKAAEINKVKPGQLFLDGARLLIQCGQNALVILKLQLAGKKIMNSGEFINGYKNLIEK